MLSPKLIEAGYYRKQHQPTLHYTWLWTLVQVVNQTSGRSGSASMDDPAEYGCSRSRTTMGSTSTTPGGSHMTTRLGGRYDLWPAKRSSEWVSGSSNLAYSYTMPSSRHHTKIWLLWEAAGGMHGLIFMQCLRCMLLYYYGLLFTLHKYTVNCTA